MTALEVRFRGCQQNLDIRHCGSVQSQEEPSVDKRWEVRLLAGGEISSSSSKSDDAEWEKKIANARGIDLAVAGNIHNQSPASGRLMAFPCLVLRSRLE